VCDTPLEYWGEDWYTPLEISSEPTFTPLEYSSENRLISGREF